jgi:hypothetical protein
MQMTGKPRLAAQQPQVHGVQAAANGFRSRPFTSAFFGSSLREHARSHPLSLGPILQSRRATQSVRRVVAMAAPAKKAGKGVWGCLNQR